MASTILRFAVGSTDTTLNVNGTINFPVNGGIVTIDSEQIQYASATDNQLLNCTRGFNSTSPASHVVNSTVTLTPPPAPSGLDMQNQRIINLADPINDQDAATKDYVDDSSGGGGITQLTGAVLAGPGSGSQVATLPVTGVSPGTYTYSQITVTNTGLITSASSGTQPITHVAGTAGDISVTGPFSNTVIDLVPTAVTPGSYTNTSLTVDANGRITSASSGSNTVANVARTNQGADISSTSLFTPSATALYLFNVYAVTTVANPSDTSTPSINFTYTDDFGSQSYGSGQLDLTTAGAIFSNNVSFSLECVSGHLVSYSFTGGGTYGTARYSLYITVTKLS